jgi:hypothetical protein
MSRTGMDWFDRDQADAGIMLRSGAARPPGCKGLLITFLVVVIGFLIVALASGWVHITKVAP